MDAEDLLVHDRGEGEAVEDVAEHAPQLDVVPALALVVKAVDARDAVALVVPPEQKEILRVLDLVRQQQTDHLETLLTPVHVVAEEQVVRLGGEPAIFEES